MHPFKFKVLTKLVAIFCVWFLTSTCSDTQFVSEKNTAAKESIPSEANGTVELPHSSPSPAPSMSPNPNILVSTSAVTSTPSPSITPTPAPTMNLCGVPKPGFLGQVYRLPENLKKLPDFSAMSAEGQVRSSNLNVAKRSWSTGFPGVASLVEWFAIDFVSVLDIQNDAEYFFRTVSDDGSKVYINNNLVVDNDGIHPPRTRSSSRAMLLAKGKHLIKVSWYQGPRAQIALQLYWKEKSERSYNLIPDSLLSVPDNCNLPNLGVWP